MKNIVVCFLLSFFGALALEACAPINGEVETPRTAASASRATTSGGERSPSSPTPTTGVGDECGTSRDPVVLARCNERARQDLRDLLNNNQRLTQAVTRVSAACETSRDPAVRALCDAVNRVAPRPTAVTTAVGQPPAAPAPVAQPSVAPAPTVPNAGVPPMGMPMPGVNGTQTPFRVMPGGTIGNIAYSGTPAWALQGGIVGLAPFTITLVDVPFAVRVFVNGVAVCHTQDGINFTQVTFQGETFCVVPPREIGHTDLNLLAHNPSQRQEVLLYGYHYNSYAGGVTGRAGGVTVHVTPAQYRGRVTAVNASNFQ
jgi:hypothetical protein